MTILVEWNFGRGPVWASDYNTGWVESEDGGWVSSDYLSYLSDEPAALDRFWTPYIIGFTPPIRKMDTLHGGYLKWDFGSIELSPGFFSDHGQWPPPVNSSVKIWFAATTEAAKIKLVEGDVHRVGFNRESVTYDIYGPKYDAQLLEEREAHNGDTVPMPRAFGTVEHANPVQLPDVNGAPCYWACSLRAGTLGSDWHVYDDGVEIDDKVFLPAYDPYVFVLVSPPVGELTVSGTGEYGTLAEIFAWIAGDKLPLEYDSSLAADPSPGVHFFATSQDIVVNFLSAIAAWNRHFFWIDDTILYVADLDADNGASTITEYGFFNSQYDLEPPLAKLTAEWTVRTAVEETIGKHIKDAAFDAVVISPYTYGDERDFRPYDFARSEIVSKLSAIRDTIHAERVELSMPISAAIPSPGEETTIIDESGAGDITAVIHAREYRLDIHADRMEIVVSGEGTIS